MHNITSILLIDGKEREREEAVIVFPIEVLSQTVGKLSYFSAFHISLFLGRNRCATAINTEISPYTNLDTIYNHSVPSTFNLKYD